VAIRESFGLETVGVMGADAARAGGFRAKSIAGTAA